MNLEYLAWDSDFFKKKIGKIDYDDDEETLSLSLKNAREEQYNLIYLFSPESVFLSDNILSYFSGKLVDRKVLYSKNIKEDEFSIDSDVIEYESTELTPDLESLAYLSGIYSRFRLDENFQKEDFFNLYKMWMNKSLTKEMADRIFITKNNKNEITSMVTLKYSDSWGAIGLIAVSDQCQGKGIGQMLINACIDDLKKRNIYRLEVPTQLDNHNACKFYERCGFEKKMITNIYHFGL